MKGQTGIACIFDLQEALIPEGVFPREDAEFD